MELYHNKPVISVVMPVYNAKKYIKDAIDSIVHQSFEDFECIIIDDGSTDNTRDIINSYDDRRIVLVENGHDYIGSLNKGMNTAKGKYIARMDADDIMHPDRLRIQHYIMETEPSITVCGTWINIFGENTRNRVFGEGNGLVENPLLIFLKRCFIAHPTAMIRADYLRKHRIQYKKEYNYAEDYKLWTDIAMQGGKFYVENQPLLYYRTSEDQVTNRKRENQKKVAERISNEVLDFLLERNYDRYPELGEIHKSLCCLKEKGLMSDEQILLISHEIFVMNKTRLILA